MVPCQFTISFRKYGQKQNKYEKSDLSKASVWMNLAVVQDPTNHDYVIQMYERNGFSLFESVKSHGPSIQVSEQVDS